MTKAEDHKRAEEIAKRFIGIASEHDVEARRRGCVDAITAYAEEEFARGRADGIAQAAAKVKHSALVILAGVKSEKIDEQGKLLLTESVAMLKGIEQEILASSPNPSYAEEVRREQRQRDARVAETIHSDKVFDVDSILRAEIATAIRNEVEPTKD